MKVVTTNLLNRFWKNGVKPIKEALTGKLDSSRIINSLLATEAGFALDARQGKVLDDKLTELDGNIDALNGTDCAAGSALKFRTIPSGQNPTYGAYSTGLYVYGGYSTGAPDDWAGVILSLRLPVGTMKYAFTFGGKIYFMRHNMDGTVSLAWTLV